MGMVLVMLRRFMLCYANKVGYQYEKQLDNIGFHRQNWKIFLEHFLFSK